MFLVLEQGKLAAVDWVQYARDQVQTRLVETQSHIIEATVNLRPDATASHSVALISTAGERGEPMKSERDLGERRSIRLRGSEFEVAGVELEVKKCGVSHKMFVTRFED